MSVISQLKKMDPEVFPNKNEKTAKNLFRPPIPVTSYEIKLTHGFFCKNISAKFSSKSLTECLWREYIKDYEKLECSHRKSSNQLF